MSRPQATSILRIEDERFTATEWRFAPGAQTGWHVHGHDYVIVPLTDGRLLLEEPGGEDRRAELRQHVPYSRRTGVEHNVINAGEAPLAFLEVEALGCALALAREALLARFTAAWNGRDLDALMACMVEDCAFRSAEGPDAEGREHQGADAVQAAFAAIFETYPQAEWRDATHRVMGDLGVSTWRLVGRDRDGRAVEVEGCDLVTFQGARIAAKNSFRKSPAG